MTKDFVPTEFDVPTSLIKDQFRLEVLEPSVVEFDFEAVMSSRVNLRYTFAENDEWPSDEMTLEENNNDLILHHEEFHKREAFAYTVLTPDRKRCIGCVYIEPCNKEGFDAEVYFWIRDDTLHLESEFYMLLRKWLNDDWPFTRIAWPGREVSWEKWGKRSHDHI